MQRFSIFRAVLKDMSAPGKTALPANVTLAWSSVLPMAALRFVHPECQRQSQQAMFLEKAPNSDHEARPEDNHFSQTLPE
jgi:hypothetical protein